MQQSRILWRRHALFASAALAVLATGRAGDVAADTGLTIPRITAFGDSYSKVPRSVKDPVTGKFVRVNNWLEQSRNEGKALALAPFAMGGATAANVAGAGTRKTFASQLNAWIGTGAPLGQREATAVYFGYNDINSFSDLSASKSGYATGVNTLVKRGANAGDRRMFLFLVHNWGRNPAQKGDPGAVFKNRTLAWNAHVKSVATKYAGQNVVTVDLYTTFNNVFAKPGLYGLTNVKTVDLANSKTTALYADKNHFGEKGQDIIQQAFLEVANRAWGVTTVMSASATTATQVAQDIDQGIALGIDSLPAQQRLGVNAFLVGDLAPASAEATRAVETDVTRAGFVQAYHPDERPDGGVGVNYALSPSTSLGVVIGHYGESLHDELERASQTEVVASDSVSVYLGHKAGGFDLRTRLTVNDEEHVRSNFDELTGTTSQARFGGRTTEVSQRAGYPMAFGDAVLTPWVELGHRLQEIDTFSLDSAYTSRVTYAAADAGETFGRFGIDAASKPFQLGETTSLRLHGGLVYTQSFARDDYRVTISEAAGLTPDQEETIERPQTREIGLRFGGELAVGQRLSLGLQAVLSENLDLGSEQEVTTRLSYRFY